MPCPVKHFLDDGWMISHGSNKLEPGKTYENLEIYDGETLIATHITVWNPYQKSRKITDCLAIGIKFNNNQGNFYLPGGLPVTNYLTASYIIIQYGEPETSYETEAGLFLCYADNKDQFIGFTVSQPNSQTGKNMVTCKLMNRKTE